MTNERTVSCSAARNDPGDADHARPRRRGRGRCGGAGVQRYCVHEQDPARHRLR